MRPMGEMDYKFAQLIWQHEPIRSADLIELAWKELGWKKSTSYTVLKKLSDRGLFVNENTIVRSLIPEDEIRKQEASRFLKNIFDGSIGSLFNALTGGETLSEEDYEELKHLLDEYEAKK